MGGHSHDHPHRKGDGGADEEIIGLAASFVSAQVALAQDPLKARDAYARGYVLGVCDALTQRAGVLDDESCLFICMHVLLDVFGEEAGEDMGRRLLQEMGRGASLQGQQDGGRDVMEWLARPDRDTPPPMTLARHAAGG